MKKLLIFLLLSAFACIVNAQSLTPRFGNTPNQDNTGRSLNYKFNNTAERAGADTVKLIPSSFETYVIPTGTITDSISYQIKSSTSAYAGDRITFIVVNSSGSGHKLKFVGSAWQVSSSGASITLTTAKRATIEFVFDGVYWLETKRVVQ